MQKMPQEERVLKLIKELEKLYPDATCELHWQTPLELLVAVILSAQCTDKRVNLITPALFNRFTTAADYAHAQISELEEYIRSTGFYHAKAKYIQEACRKIETDFNGQVPSRMEALLTLPGVARKTANVVLGTAFHITSGVVVDTHVKRLSKRLGLTTETTPEKIEQALMKIIPQKNWVLFGQQLVWHGRRVCDAKKPRCETCTLRPICPSSSVPG